SIPVFVVSGQVRRPLMADFSKLRQNGPQEINIEPMVRPVVKYFSTVMDPRNLRRELECAWWHATTGRPGPVWINLPLDVQAAEFDPDTTPRFEEPTTDRDADATKLSAAVAEAIQRLRAAGRPVIIGGNGIHFAGAHAEFRAFAEALGAPV